MTPTDDVLVVGGGPAGRALAAECGALGLRTTLLDPAPDRPWPATYGAWDDELAGLPGHVVSARAAGRAIALTEHRLDRVYAVLDVAALRTHLDDRLARGGVRVRAGRAVAAPAAGTVALADGTVLRAGAVVDAGGRAQPLDARPVRARVPAEQTAYGVVVDAAAARPVVAPGEALFMDWRPDHGEPGAPTFLYAIPLDGDRVLLEETSLARRPGLPLPVLRRRLLARLRHHGVTVPPGAAMEKVSFPLDRPRHRGHVLGFGAAAPLVHPASGYSLATALGLAPAVARALARRPGAAGATVWPPAARVVHHVRGIGLEALLRMPPAEVAPFFEVFFGLPDRHRRAYLSGRDDLRGTLAAMAALFGAADATLRRRLVGPAVLPRLRHSEAAPNG
ncbi:putative carotenoid cyclase [Pseudonocardia hydrocarbonoxydans]|uniref:Putative carotenoid cyclase n=1 Tax=Pseudonocardia hydrocarbonoxydans TaxID=76726 RepID=A0A4Y3WIA5_9PSEU|nr:lycopene cyclase family protein [Pseudonocardia hydrocarbonoxydans]GEC17951.1 putative carotenoid cyclase [Pseudonocardia hydrocarbonoxydans]